jgi:hypothetical protein
LDVVKVLIDKQDSVLIEESDGRDLTCVVASLVQLLADCHYRSLKGLQALIQKEWIVTGHRFMTRCDHLDAPAKGSLLIPQSQSSSKSLPRNIVAGSNIGDSTWYDNSTEVLSESVRSGSVSPTKDMQMSVLSEPAVKSGKSLTIKRSTSYYSTGGNEDESNGYGHVRKEHCPIFLLFLDCVYQLILQYPTAFEFTEFFLQRLWSSSYSCLYDSFLFDSEKDRLDMIARSSMMSGLGSLQPRMKSAWEGIGMSENDKNPLYKVVGKASQFSSLLGAQSEFGVTDYLTPNSSMPALQFWSSCYLRWVPMSHSVGGGRLSSVAIQRQVVNEINWLLERPSGQIVLDHIAENGKTISSPTRAPITAQIPEDFPTQRARAKTMPSLRSEPLRSKSNVSRVSYGSYLEDAAIRNLSVGNFAEEVLSMVQFTKLELKQPDEVQATESPSHSTPNKEWDTRALYV